MVRVQHLLQGLPPKGTPIMFQGKRNQLYTLFRQLFDRKLLHGHKGKIAEYVSNGFVTPDKGKGNRLSVTTLYKTLCVGSDLEFKFLSSKPIDISSVQ